MSERFASLLPTPNDTPTLLGLEHEYEVVDTTGRQIDFRVLVHGLGLGRQRLDPGDPFSYRLSSGSAVTCDQAEAEIVLAPVHAVAGAAKALADRSAAERTSLASRLPDRLELVGHSTHLSVGVEPAICERVARAVLADYGCDLMRLAAGPKRRGVWVRPRHGRVEICVDFVDGPRLQALATFAATAVTSSSAGDAADPRILRVRAQTAPPGPAPHRNGWHVAGSDFREGDPFAAGDASPLGLQGGGTMPAGEHLRLVWDALRRDAQILASPLEIAHLDRVAVGRPTGRSVQADPAGPNDPLPQAFGDVLRSRVRRGYEVAVVALTWWFVVLLMVGDRTNRRAFACVPRDRLPAFVGLLDAGDLDEVIFTYLSRRPWRRVLAGAWQTSTPALYDEIGPRRGLLPVDRATGEWGSGQALAA